MALAVEVLGCVPYAEALGLQHEAVAARRQRGAGDRLLLLEHPPVVTLGRSTRREHLLASPEALAGRGVELHEVARGGDVTYHGPGQLVGYLIVDLAARGAADVHAHLRRIETALGSALSTLGVPTTPVPGWTGVFVARSTPGAPRKIASIGVGVKSWVSYHGFALNVDLDLAAFADIVPCGLHQVEMTSVARELGPGGHPPGLAGWARTAVAEAFAEHWV